MNAKEKANEQKYYAQFEKGTMHHSCVSCAGEHEQLAEWLEELKANKDTSAEVYESGYKRGYSDGYAKGIDEFARRLKYENRQTMSTTVKYSFEEFVDKIAEEMRSAEWE